MFSLFGSGISSSFKGSIISRASSTTSLLSIKSLKYASTFGAYCSIIGVILESKAGREAVLAKVIIDATGDADVAQRSGALTTKMPKMTSFCKGDLCDFPYAGQREQHITILNQQY